MRCFSNFSLILLFVVLSMWVAPAPAWAEQVQCDVNMTLYTNKEGLAEEDEEDPGGQLAISTSDKGRYRLEIYVGSTVDSEELTGSITFTNSDNEKIEVYESETGGSDIGESKDFPMSGTSITVTLWVQAVEVTDDEVTLTAKIPNDLEDVIKVTTTCGGGGCSSNGYCESPHDPADADHGGSSDDSGGSGGRTGGVNIQCSLGQSNYGDDAGYISLYSDQMDASLTSPASLFVFANEGVTVTRDGSDNLQSVVTPNGRIDVSVVSAYAYDLVYKDKLGVTYRTIRIENPNGAANTDVLEIKRSGDRTTFQRYTWDDTNKIMTLEKGQDALNLLTRSELDYDDLGGGVRTETRKIIEPSTSTTLQMVIEKYEVKGWGEVLTERAIDIDLNPATTDDRLVTSYAYHEDISDVDNYGHMKSMIDHRGYWQRYEYDELGRTVETIRQFEDEELDETDMAALRTHNVVETVTYLEPDLNDADSETELVRKVQVKAPVPSSSPVVSGLERTSYRISWSQSNPTGTADATKQEYWDVRCVSADPESGYASTTAFLDALMGSSNYLGHMVTRRQRHAPGETNQYEPYRINHANGNLTLYTYTSASVTQVESGVPNSAGTAIAYGTKTVTEVDSGGNTVSRERYMRQSAAASWTVMSLMKTASSDDLGRPLTVDYFFGTEAADEIASLGTGSASYSIDTTYACCGVKDKTDRRGLKTVYTYDDLGRLTSTVSADNTDGQLTVDRTLDALGRATQTDQTGSDGVTSRTISKTVYDGAGRVTEREDALGNKTFYTYRRVKPADGTAYVVGTDTGPFYWEQRVYPHNAASGPVQVSWLDSHGRTVQSMLASVTTDWSGSAPSSIESIATEHARSTTVYDWAGRALEQRAYYDLDGLGLTSAGTEGTHYNKSTSTYDALGRMANSTDAAGNYSETVYDDLGRAYAQLRGTSSSNELMVSRSYYDSNRDGTGDRLPYATRTYRMKSVSPSTNLLTILGQGTIVAAGDAEMTEYYTYVDTDETLAAGTMTRWSKPEVGPWSQSVTNHDGRSVESATVKNGNTSYVLSKTSYVYDGTDPYQLNIVRQYEVDGAGATTGKYLEMSHAYDDATRQIKTSSPGGGFTKTQFDVYGRALRTAQGAYEGTDTSADSFTDDVLLTEMLYEYDNSDNVTATATYSRMHDATVTGLLSASSSADQRRPRYTATWYDNANRPTHTVDYGTETSP